MQSWLSVFRLRPLTLFVYRKLFDHRLSNLLISDACTTLRIPQQELNISPLRQVARLGSGFQCFFAEVLQRANRAYITESCL